MSLTAIASVRHFLNRRPVRSVNILWRKTPAVQQIKRADKILSGQRLTDRLRSCRASGRRVAEGVAGSTGKEAEVSRLEKDFRVYVKISVA